MKLHHQCTTRAIFSGSGGCGMRAVLTQAMIEKMPLPAKRKDCRDTRLKGLILRVSPNGVKSFYCEYARGKRVWLGRADALGLAEARRSEEHTSELQSLMRISYAVFCLKKKTHKYLT